MLGTAFGTFFVVFVLLTAVLIYHWRTYALLHHTHLVAAEWWFLIISALLFGAASVFLVLYSWWR